MGKRVGPPPLVLESPGVVSLVRMLEQLWRTYGSIVQKNAFGASFVGLPFYVAVCARRVPTWPDARCPVRSAFRASAAPGIQIATGILP